MLKDSAENVLRDFRERSGELRITEKRLSALPKLLSALQGNEIRVESLCLKVPRKLLSQEEQNLSKLLCEIKSSSCLHEINLEDTVSFQKSVMSEFEELLKRNCSTVKNLFSSNSTWMLEKTLFVLSEKNGLEKIELRNEILDYKCTSLLAKIISKSETLKELDFELSSDNQLNETLEEVVEAISRNHSINTLVLSYFRPIKFPLVGNNSIENLFFERCKFEAEAVQQLADFFCRNCSVRKLRFGGFKKWVDCLPHNESLFESLQKNETLLSLELENVEIGEEGSVQLSKFLRENGSLTQLELSFCSIQSCSLLFEALKSNKVLKSLSFSNNKFENCAGFLLAQTIKENNSLETMNVSRNAFGESIHNILHSLISNRSIKTFDCEETMQNMSSHSSVVNLVSENRTLTKLGISENRIPEKTCRGIFEAMEENQTIKSLDISGNCFDSQYLAIKKMLEANCTLKTFDMRSSNKNLLLKWKIARQVRQELVEAIKSNCSLTKIEVSELTGSSEMAIRKEISLNKKIEEMDEKAKLSMMIIHKRKDGNLVCSVPRRLLIHLLSFLPRIKIDKSSLNQKLQLF